MGSEEDAQLSQLDQTFLPFPNIPPAPTQPQMELTNLETVSLPWVADT